MVRLDGHGHVLIQCLAARVIHATKYFVPPRISRCTTPETCANMDRFKNVAKGGWHPEKSAGSNTGGKSDSKLGQVVNVLNPTLSGWSLT